MVLTTQRIHSSVVTSDTPGLKVFLRNVGVIVGIIIDITRDIYTPLIEYEVNVFYYDGRKIATQSGTFSPAEGDLKSIFVPIKPNILAQSTKGELMALIELKGIVSFEVKVDVHQSYTPCVFAV